MDQTPPHTIEQIITSPLKVETFVFLKFMTSLQVLLLSKIANITKKTFYFGN